jgi:DNA-binding PadR family transcriptional regulator
MHHHLHEHSDRPAGRVGRSRRHEAAFAHPGGELPDDDPRFEGWRRGRVGGRHRHWDEGWAGPARRGRGAIKAGILLVLAEQPMHGYQIMQELSTRSGGAWHPSPGAIYPTLQRLEDKGLVRSDEEDARRVFRLTDTGRMVADRLALKGFVPWEVAGPADRERSELRQALGHLVDAVRQVGRAGSPEQRGRVLDLLRDARRGVYRILAEDDPADPAAPTEGGPADQ